jgi:nucleoside-diphosphate-sugar epimerase
MDFTPSELYTAIRRQVPDLEIVYNADFRQEIAKTWPQSLDDSAARADWGWDPKFDIDLMTEDMLKVLGDRLVAA